MKYRIELLTFEEWKKENLRQDPRIHNSLEFEAWKDKRSVHLTAASLSTCSASSQDMLDPKDVCEFAEKILLFIDEKKPIKMKLAEYEHAIEAIAICKDNTQDRVEEYLKEKYRDYVRNFWKRMEYAQEDDFSDEVLKTFRLNVEKVEEQK